MISLSFSFSLVLFSLQKHGGEFFFFFFPLNYKKRVLFVFVFPYLHYAVWLFVFPSSFEFVVSSEFLHFASLGVVCRGNWGRVFTSLKWKIDPLF